MYFSYLYYMHSSAQGDERHGNLSQEKNLCSNEENELSFRAQVDSQRGRQVFHNIFIEYTRSGRAIQGCQYRHLLYIPALRSYSTAMQTSLLKPSLCMDEVLDPGITNPVQETL